MQLYSFKFNVKLKSSRYYDYDFLNYHLLQKRSNLGKVWTLVSFLVIIAYRKTKTILIQTL